MGFFLEYMYRIAVIFRVVLFSLGVNFLAIFGKNFRGRSILNHTPCTRGEMACYFEVEAMVRCYKDIWDETRPYWELAKAIGTSSCSTSANARASSHTYLRTRCGTPSINGRGSLQLCGNCFRG